MFGENDFDLVVSDIKMEPVSGLVLLQNIKSIRPEIPIIMMTAYASVETALDTLKMGAFDYITKPFKLDDFMEVVERALASVTDPAGNIERSGDPESYCCLPGVVGVSSGMQDTCRMLELVAPTEATVLLRGEKGTGRSMLARVVHSRSRRGDKACVEIDCAALPPESAVDLFVGRTVDDDTPGDPEYHGLLGANGGTVILENVDALSPDLQKTLLRAICDKVVTLPSGREAGLDLRIVATADVGLQNAVVEGRFLEDLFRRISLVSVEIRPLRERREDILPLVWLFLRQKRGDEDKLPELAADARGALKHYPWPGNIAELCEVMEHAWQNRVDGKIMRDSLPEPMLRSLTESMSVFSGTGINNNQATSLMAFLRRKGVDLNRELSKRKGQG